MSGYFGAMCEHKHSCGNCEAHLCDGNKRCKICPSGFSGINCDIANCSDIDMCNNNGKIYHRKGKCFNSGYKRICECFHSWKGEFCNIKKCINENICNNKGYYIINSR